MMAMGSIYIPCRAFLEMGRLSGPPKVPDGAAWVPTERF